MEGDAPPVWFFSAFPLFFVGMWLAVTTILGLLSGWYALARRFPDRDDQVLAKFGSQSGSMGLGVGLKGVLVLSVCRGGLRVGIWRIFGPFSPPFYVPWGDLTVQRRDVMVWPRADLRFGDIGKLTVSGDLADRIARATDQKAWPEAVPPPQARPIGRYAAQALAEWLLMSAFFGTFFTLAPRLQGQLALPTGVTIGFPAVFFGLVALFRFLRKARG